MKNIINMIATEAIVVFLVSRKIAEKNTEVVAMVPKSNMARRNDVASLSQCSPYSMKFVDVVIPNAMNS